MKCDVMGRSEAERRLGTSCCEAEARGVAARCDLAPRIGVLWSALFWRGAECRSDVEWNGTEDCAAVERSELFWSEAEECREVWGRAAIRCEAEKRRVPR